jgi:hypothetical protein
LDPAPLPVGWSRRLPRTPRPCRNWMMAWSLPALTCCRTLGHSLRMVFMRLRSVRHVGIMLERF